MVEAVSVPAHLTPSESPRPKQLHLLHAEPSLGWSCHREKSLASVHIGLPPLCSTVCDPMDCGLPGSSVREGSSPGKNTVANWPILVAVPF